MCSLLLATLWNTASWADFESGQSAYADGRFREAFLEWENDAARGNPVAQFFIGNMYAAGEGIDADLEMANTWYKKSAKQGHVESAVRLATNYRLGQGVEDVDYREATKWLYMAAESGHPIARFDLGEIFLYGDKKHNLQPAVYHASQWFRLAALDGVVLARLKLAQLYFEGEGVDRDDVNGMVWLSLAYNIATGLEPENKWSKMAMDLDRQVPGDKDERDLRTYIADTWKEKSLSVSPDVMAAAQDILTSGAPEKIR
jgi:TPR repeat protein